MQIHTVKEDESIYSVAADYGISPIKLAENNGLDTRARLMVGEELLILIPTRMTTARRGDTLHRIAERFSVRECDLLAINPELMGRGRLYDGQPIAIRYGEPLWGMGIGNGYFYRGCSEERLLRAMPYLSYVTVAAGVARGGAITLLFDTDGVVNLVRAAGKLPLLRIYIEDSISRDGWRELIGSAAIMAKTHDYHGITLCGISRFNDEAKELAFEAKKMLMECDLVLFVEGDIEGELDYADLADGAVLTYDKLHREEIPAFADGDGPEYKRYSENHESMRAFIDLSPFAYGMGKYIPKTDALEIVRRGRGEIRAVSDGDCSLGSVGRGHGERLYVWDSIESTKKRLEAVSELCYLGISFDIARVPIHELLMFRVMFSSGIGVS